MRLLEQDSATIPTYFCSGKLHLFWEFNLGTWLLPGPNVRFPKRKLIEISYNFPSNTRFRKPTIFLLFDLFVGADSDFSSALTLVFQSGNWLKFSYNFLTNSRSSKPTLSPRYQVFHVPNKAFSAIPTSFSKAGIEEKVHTFFLTINALGIQPICFDSPLFGPVELALLPLVYCKLGWKTEC